MSKPFHSLRSLYFLAASALALAACSGSSAVPVQGLAPSQSLAAASLPDAGCPQAYSGGVPLDIRDLSGLPKQRLALYFTSSVPSNLAQYEFLSSNGTMTVFAPGNAAARFPLAKCFPGSLGKKGKRFTFPLLPSGRIWIAFGQLPIAGTANGQFSAPSGWTQKAAGYNVVWDTIELSYNNPGIFVNLTRVDMLGLPMTLKVLPLAKDDPGSWKEVGERPGSYPTILRQLRSDRPFDQTIVLVPSAHVPRIINPSHLPSFPDVFNSPAYYSGGFINKVAGYYQSPPSPISYDTSYKGAYCPGSWSAGSNGSAFTFSQGSQQYSYPNSLFSTNYIFGDNPAPQYASNTCPYLLDKILLQELNRGVAMSATHPNTQPSTFYPSGTINNQYACVLHKYALHHATYAFAYDDAAGQASTIQNSAPSAVLVNIEPIPKRLPKPSGKQVCS
jgi:hypothetical protein